MIMELLRRGETVQIWNNLLVPVLLSRPKPKSLTLLLISNNYRHLNLYYSFFNLIAIITQRIVELTPIMSPS